MHRYGAQEFTLRAILFIQTFRWTDGWIHVSANILHHTCFPLLLKSFSISYGFHELQANLFKQSRALEWELQEQGIKRKQTIMRKMFDKKTAKTTNVLSFQTSTDWITKQLVPIEFSLFGFIWCGISTKSRWKWISVYSLRTHDFRLKTNGMHSSHLKANECVCMHSPYFVSIKMPWLEKISKWTFWRFGNIFKGATLTSSLQYSIKYSPRKYTCVTINSAVITPLIY